MIGLIRMWLQARKRRKEREWLRVRMEEVRQKEKEREEWINSEQYQKLKRITQRHIAQQEKRERGEGRRRSTYSSRKSSSSRSNNSSVCNNHGSGV